MTYNICVVCSGNICRSPIGAVVLAALAEKQGMADQVHITSGGMGDWHVGDPADRRARAALRKAGFNGEAHRAAQFQRDWFEQNDLILAADSTHVRALRTLAPDDAAREKVRLIREFDPAAVENDDLEVDDPYYGSDADFDHVVKQLVAASAGVLDHVRSRS